MTPYYEADGITIYHGDCREVLPGLPTADLLVSDPPYASAAATVTSGWGKSKHGGSWGDMSLVGLMVESTLVAANWPGQVLWMADHLGYCAIVPVLFRRYQTVQSVVWDKDMLGMGATFRKQTEMAAYARRTDAPPASKTNKRDLIRLRPPVKSLHPAEKPVALMVEIMDGLVGGLVLDPYCGSGSTLLAARLQGRRAIGIEIEERYCAIAAERLSQGVLDMGAA